MRQPGFNLAWWEQNVNPPPFILGSIRVLLSGILGLVLLVKNDNAVVKLKFIEKTCG